MGPYVFNPDDAVRFAHERRIKVRRNGNELIFGKCPYCGSLSEDKDKFAINLTTGAFNCLRASCGAKGNMITLSRDFGFSLGRDVDEYYSPRREFRDMRKYGRPKEIREPAIRYLASRGISESVIRAYEITTKPDDDNLLSIPFFDDKGDLQAVKFRKIDFDKTRDKNKELFLKGCRPILFGMNLCDAKKSDTLVLTEGQIDALSVAEAGILNAVSVPTGAKGFSWVPYCWDFMKKFKTLVVFGDHENGHITLLDEMTKRFRHGKVKHVREEDYKDCKDANELLRKYGADAVRAAVANSEIVENPYIRKLSKVEKPESRETINTGISQLNKLIKGFSFGQVVVLTGERGLGKSTLGSQFILEAVDQEYPAIIYSGEMMDWQVQEWVDRQAAGDDHINRIKEDNGYIRFAVDAEAEKKIHEWYDDLLYIRENDVRDEEAAEALITTLRTSVTQYGVRVALIDNLMTAVDDDMASDFYRQQSAFMRQLVKTAKEYDALIILVAHPRKSQGRVDFTNDDISGSGNITNLADIVLNYAKPKNEDETNAPRILQVTKNRVNGLLEYNGIPLYFSDASKRITESTYGDKKEKRYKWETEEDAWHNADNLPDEIPF